MGHSHLAELEPTLGTEHHCCPLWTARHESTDTVHESVTATHSKLKLLSVGFSSCDIEICMGTLDQPLP